MRWAIQASWAILLWAMASQAWAITPSFPDRGRRAVVDAAGVIPDEAEAELDARIVAWNRATGHQLAVVTVPSLQGHPIQDYGYRLLRHWRLGRADVDDGAILLLASNERQVRIEVGYGLEPVLTDALSSRIIGETIRPALRAGDIAGALDAGAERIMQAADEEQAIDAPRDADRPFPWVWSVLGLVGCIFLGIFLYPLAETWYAIWPFYVLFPARTKRAEERHARRLAEAEGKRQTQDERRYATVTRAEDRARAERKGTRGKRARHSQSAAADASGKDALESLRERAESSYDSSAYDSYDSSSSSSDSGFDSGGGSGGGGGADSDY
jgi:uncharacterized protein